MKALLFLFLVFAAISMQVARAHTSAHEGTQRAISSVHHGKR